MRIEVSGHFGYFDRFDQVRGVSPMAAGVNTLRDTYEGFDYALAKMKVSQLFGLAFFREKSDPVDQPSPSDDDGAGYEVDFGRGPVLLDLDPGDRAEFLESKSPATEFQQFLADDGQRRPQGAGHSLQLLRRKLYKLQRRPPGMSACLRWRRYASALADAVGQWLAGLIRLDAVHEVGRAKSIWHLGAGRAHSIPFDRLQPSGVKLEQEHIAIDDAPHFRHSHGLGEREASGYIAIGRLRKSAH